MVIRIVFAVVALLFIVGTITFVHLAAWYWIRTEGMSFYAAAGILGGVDLLVAVILLVLASRSSASRVEREALDVRNRAIAGIGSALTLSQFALPVLRLVTGLRQRRRRA